MTNINLYGSEWEEVYTLENDIIEEDFDGLRISIGGGDVKYYKKIDSQNEDRISNGVNANSDTINLNDYKQVDSGTYSNFSGERIIRWKDRKQLHYIKKEDKFPKEFKDSCYKITINKDELDIFDIMNNSFNSFSVYHSLPLLIEAIDYWEKKSK